MKDREGQRELDGFDQMILQRIAEEERAWQPEPPLISGYRMRESMKNGDGDRKLMVLAFLASLSWIFLGGFGIAMVFRISFWVTFALSTMVYSMLLSVLYMIVVLKNRRKSKEVSY